MSALGEDQDTGRGLLGGKAEALEEAGDAEETRRQRKLEGAGGMVGGSVILCPFYSVSRPLLFSVSICPSACEMPASDKVLGKPRAAGRKRGQGTRAAEPGDRR